MNKLSTSSVAVFLCILSLSSCKDSEETNTAYNISIEPELSVSREVNTRKTETYFQEGEAVGFLLLNPDGSLYTNSPGYEKYTYMNRRWNCTQPTILNNNEARVYAFYPWSVSLDYALYGAQAIIETPTQTDYLTGKQVDGSLINAQHPKTRLNMMHILAKVRFSIARGAYMGVGKLTSAQFQCIGGSLLGTGYKVDLKTGSINTVGASTDASPHDIGTWGRDGIILSQESTGTAGTDYLMIPGNGKIKIELMIDNIAYTVLCNLDGSISSNGLPRTLRSGSIYTIHLRMAGSSLEITSDNMILHDWNNGGSISTQ